MGETAAKPKPTMLEIGERQDEALRMLDDLERRIDLVLAEFAPALPGRPAVPLEPTTENVELAPLVQMAGLVNSPQQSDA